MKKRMHTRKTSIRTLPAARAREGDGGSRGRASGRANGKRREHVVDSSNGGEGRGHDGVYESGTGATESGGKLLGGMDR